MAKVKVKVLSGTGPHVDCDSYITLETTGDQPNSTNFNYDVITLDFSSTNKYTIPSSAQKTFEQNEVVYSVSGIPLAKDTMMLSVVVDLFKNGRLVHKDTASFSFPPAAIAPSCK